MENNFTFSKRGWDLLEEKMHLTFVMLATLALLPMIEKILMRFNRSLPFSGRPYTATHASLQSSVLCFFDVSVIVETSYFKLLDTTLVGDITKNEDATAVLLLASATEEESFTLLDFEKILLDDNRSEVFQFTFNTLQLFFNIRHLKMKFFDSVT